MSLNSSIKQTPQERLLIAVESTGLSQRKFGRLIGKNVNAINKIVQGRAKLDKTLALAIEAVSGVSSVWILSGEGPFQKNPRESLDLSERLVLEMLRGDERTLAGKVLAWIESKASIRKYSFTEENPDWDEEQTERYNSLVKDLKRELEWFFSQEDGQYSALYALQILYFGDVTANEESEAGLGYEELHQTRIDEIKKIRQELEKLIGEGLKKKN